jgi:hypothetical protein
MNAQRARTGRFPSRESMRPGVRPIEAGDTGLHAGSGFMRDPLNDVGAGGKRCGP